MSSLYNIKIISKQMRRLDATAPHLRPFDLDVLVPLPYNMTRIPTLESEAMLWLLNIRLSHLAAEISPIVMRDHGGSYMLQVRCHMLEELPLYTIWVCPKLGNVVNLALWAHCTRRYGGFLSPRYPYGYPQSSSMKSWDFP